MLLLLLLASLTLIQAGDAFPFLFLKPNNTPMQDMLDMMQQLMTGDAVFDRNFIQNIQTCLATFDPQLPAVHDKIWQGIIDYWDMGGNSDDTWGETGSEFSECNKTESSYKGMTIYEPCNFASSAAYYHLITELCNRQTRGSKFHMRPEYIAALEKMLSALPATSSFGHASNTKLGWQQDFTTIRILEFLLHQGIMDALPYRSSILNDLSRVPRAMTSLQIVDAVQKMYSSEPVSNWYRKFESFDLPKFLIAFIGPLITALYMNFDYHLVNQSIPIIIKTFRLTEEDQMFFSNDYLPELKKAMPNIDRKKYLKENFLGNSMGTIAKMMHSFLWNEDIVFNFDILQKSIPNMIGWAVLPVVTRKINYLTNYQYFEPDFQSGLNKYPGEKWCNPKIAHPKFHVLASLGFLDVLYLGDEMNRLLTPARK